MVERPGREQEGRRKDETGMPPGRILRLLRSAANPLLPIYISGNVRKIG